jgi:hypothetical protein
MVVAKYADVSGKEKIGDLDKCLEIRVLLFNFEIRGPTSPGNALNFGPLKR